MKLAFPKGKDSWIVIGGAAAAATAVIAIANFNKAPQASSDTSASMVGDQLLPGSQDELLSALGRLSDTLNQNAHNQPPSDVKPGPVTLPDATVGTKRQPVEIYPVVTPAATGPAVVTPKPAPVVEPARITNVPIFTNATGGPGTIPSGALVRIIDGVPISVRPGGALA